MLYDNMVNDFLEEIEDEDFNPSEWLETREASEMMDKVYQVIGTQSKRITMEDIVEFEGRFE